MKTRIITATVASIFAILVMIFGNMFPIIAAIAMALINFIMCIEFLTAKNLQRNIPITVVTALFGLSMPLVSLTDLWYVPLFVYSLVLFSMLVFLYDKVSVSDVMFTYAGTTVISSAIAMFSRLCCTNGYTAFYICAVVVGPWLADSVAYFTGSAFGKHPLSPKISPKKTIEGALGGAVGSVVFLQIFGLVMQFIVYRNIKVNYLALLVIGIYCAVVSVIGDLVFSSIKRNCGIKDYGSIMPGHGGLLDRFDSVIFCVPFIYMISETWGLIIK